MANRRPRGWGWTKPPVGAQVDWGDPINKALVGCWLFNEGGGKIVKNMAGRLDGALQANAPTWQPGKWSTGLKFTAASSQYIVVGDLDTPNEMSISCWFSSVNTANQYLFGKHITTSWAVNRGGGNINYWCNTVNHAVAVPTDGLIHFLTATFALGGTVKVYMDSVLKTTATGQTMTTDDSVLAIGASNTVGNNPFDGFLDNIRLHNRALNQSEIYRLYTEPFAGIQQPRRWHGRSAAAGGFQAAWARGSNVILGAGAP